jgi:hypothetical protein
MNTPLWSLLAASLIITAPAMAQSPPAPDMPDMPGMRRMQIVMQGPGNEQRVIERRMQFGNDHGPRMGVRLETVSPRLGSYFGVKAGVLVAHSDKAELKLEDGDVITAIDGRQPTTAEQAQRILRSYAPGEKISFKLMRDRKALTVEGVMPERPMPERPMQGESRQPRRDVAPPPKAP